MTLAIFLGKIITWIPIAESTRYNTDALACLFLDRAISRELLTESIGAHRKLEKADFVRYLFRDFDGRSPIPGGNMR